MPVISMEDHIQMRISENSLSMVNGTGRIHCKKTLQKFAKSTKKMQCRKCDYRL